MTDPAVRPTDHLAPAVAPAAARAAHRGRLGYLCRCDRRRDWRGRPPRRRWASGSRSAVVAAGLIGERFLARRVAAWGYAERKDDLMVRRGVLIRRQSVIPYGRMQFIDVTAGPLERSMGLATLRMHTAAAASDARIPGLERAAAAVLRDQLAALGEAQAADCDAGSRT